MLFSIKTLCVESACLADVNTPSLRLRLRFPMRLSALALICSGHFSFYEAQADLRNWGGSVEISSIGSLEDRVLWNLRPSFNLKGEQQLWDSRALSLGVDARLRADTQSNFARSRSRYDLRFDKAALQWVGQSASVSLGWQKFIWGDTGFLDGVDVLNARDLTEPLYTDDELQKLAVPAMSLQYLAASTVFQVVIIPQPERSPIPDLPQGVILRKPRPLLFGSEPEFGLKAGGLLTSGWDINGYLASHLERVPQLRFLASAQGVEARLYEPRVFTLGLTATQTVGDLVVRCEGAAHINRALPEEGLKSEVSSDQFVLNLTADLTLFDDFLISGQLWGERWTAPASSVFVSSNLLFGGRAQKPFFSGRLEAYVGALGSFASGENLLTSGVNFRALESWQIAADVYFAETSKGYALSRRQFKNLISSSLKYQF